MTAQALHDKPHVRLVPAGNADVDVRQFRLVGGLAGHVPTAPFALVPDDALAMCDKAQPAPRTRPWGLDRHGGTSMRAHACRGRQSRARPPGIKTPHLPSRHRAPQRIIYDTLPSKFWTLRTSWSRVRSRPLRQGGRAPSGQADVRRAVSDECRHRARRPAVSAGKPSGRAQGRPGRAPFDRDQRPVAHRLRMDGSWTGGGRDRGIPQMWAIMSRLKNPSHPGEVPASLYLARTDRHERDHAGRAPEGAARTAKWLVWCATGMSVDTAMRLAGFRGPTAEFSGDLRRTHGLARALETLDVAAITPRLRPDSPPAAPLPGPAPDPACRAVGAVR